MCSNCLSPFGCIHCRDAMLENQRERRQRAKLTEHERERLGLIPKRGLGRVAAPRQSAAISAPPAKPGLVKIQFQLPAHFTIAIRR